MSTQQPLYKFGDKFTKRVRTEVEGNSQHITVEHYIISITARSTERDFEYGYKLGSSFPSAYHQPSWTSEFISEDKLEKLYKKAEDV